RQRKAYTIIQRETAPLASNYTILQGKENITFIGPLSIGIPGELLAYDKAYKEFGGGVSWSTLFSPTIRLCEKGFPVSHALAFAIQRKKHLIINDTQLREIFVKNHLTNELYKEGDIMKRIKLAQTLRQIAKEGVQTFYNGDLAKKIINEIQKRGGILTLEDLREYDIDFHEAISIDLNNSFKAFTSLAPSSGPILAFILNIISGYNFHSNDLNNIEKTGLFYHRLIETFKFAFAKKLQLGDPISINLTQLMINLTSKEYAQSIRQKINDEKTFSEEYYGDNMKKVLSGGGTAHISIVDQYGDAVGITSTINSYFGSTIVGEETGIIYNNQLDDFSRDQSINSNESIRNSISPGKRPISSKAPLIIIDNKENIRQVLGAAGGSKIVTSIAQVCLLNLLFEKNIKESIDYPRIHHHLHPNEIIFEQPFNRNILNELKRRGHNVTCMSYGSTVVQGIEWRPGDHQYWANSDIRKGGSPYGY
ncbi:unnamed protein product, partial [Rotaria sordida]